MLHLSAKRHRSIIWWEDALWKKFWATTYRTYFSVWFIGWVLLRKISENPSIWKESLTWFVVRRSIVRGGNLEGWRTDRRPWGVGNDGRIGNLLTKTHCERGDISKKRRIHVSNGRWTNQNPWKRSQPENVHLGTASTNSWRKWYWLSSGIRVHSTTSRLTSGCRRSNKRLLVHVRKLHFPPSRWTQSQTFTRREKIIPYSTEVHWRFQKYSYEFGYSAGETHWWLLEYQWVKRLVGSKEGFTHFTFWKKTSWRICGPVRD